jgi:hypothetical protein
MNKVELININKNDLDKMIREAKENINSNITDVNTIFNQHKYFYNFIKVTNVFESYKWEELKKKYIDLKKTITQNKKICKNIIKTYGSIICYYNNIMIESINMEIKLIQDNIKLLLFNFNFLKLYHKDITIKCNNIIKNINVLKLEHYDTIYSEIITKLYNIYDIYNMNKQKLKQIKSDKANILC